MAKVRHVVVEAVAPRSRVRAIVCTAALLLTAAGTTSTAPLDPKLPGQQSDQAASVAQPPTILEQAAQLYAEAERLIDGRQFKDAVEKAERALELRRQHFGERHPDVAQSLEQLGILAYQLGAYDRAETLVDQALAMREATLGPDHALVAESLSDLASILLVKADFVRPEPLFQRALVIYENAYADATGDAATNMQLRTADVLNNLALLYDRRGNYERAESHYLRTLQIRERLRGPDDPTVASALANLGGVYYSSAQYDKAVETLTRALSIQEKRLAPNHAALATPSFNLAAVSFARGDYDAAEELFQRALSIDQQNLDPRHPRLATRLMGLAGVLRLKGEYERADPLYEQAFTIREHALGPAHPQVADALIGRSLLRWATSNVSDAATLLARGAALREQTLALVLTAGSEEAKRLYLRTLDDETDIAVSLHLGAAPQSTTAAAVAFGNVLERKGRSLDAMTDHLATLRRRLDDSDRELLDQLSRAQGQLAALLLRGVSTDDQKSTATALRAEIQRLEETASARSSELRASFKHATLTEIREAVPDDTVLIEYVSYRPFFVRNKRAEAFGARRYAAYALRRDGIANSVDLGDAAAIDQNVQRLRAALATPDDGDTRQLARALYKQIVEPVETTLKDASRVVVSPDGALNLIPFGALVTPRDTFLVETHTISYVTSGRDLPGLLDNRRQQRVASAPAVFADPLFEGLRATTSPARAKTRGIDTGVLSKALQFDSLPGTAEEAEAIAKVLPDARIFTGADATEARLKSLRGPAILHIATHGFFLPGAARAAPPSSSPASVVKAPSAAGIMGDREEALVLSGLALAGVNQRWSGDGEDGILTALETAGLDLWGTRLVVLSACETGVGDVKLGDGVYGLRRALVLAGSESQVMSLWQVSDEATRDLMVDYYRRLRRGEGRADALRQVQLAMLKGRQDLQHPFFWASFILSGDWRPAFE